MLIRGSKIIRKAALLYLVALVFFVWGFAVGEYKVFPWSQLSPIYEEVVAYFSFTSGPKKSNTERIFLDHQEYKSHYSVKGFEQRDPSFEDLGYLLLARYSKKHKQVLVELFSIADRKVLHTWIPPLDDIFQQSQRFQDGPNTITTYRAQHPLLLNGGDVVFTSGEGPMVRVNGCGEVVWVINRHFHHSIEIDHLGRIVVPIVLEKKNPRVVLPVRDDGFAIVTQDGRIVKEFSITDILLKNGYRGLIYGVGTFEEDRIHLNDAQPILHDRNEASVGDIVLSSRNLSSVFLFRPGNEKISWLQTGPWLNQHDVNPLVDGSYSIFGNDTVRQKDKRDLLVNKRMSNVYVYNPNDRSILRPYSKMMSRNRVATWTAGRSKILANGDVFIEESDRGRLLRISRNSVRWEYVNSVSQGTVGAVHWSRYLSEKEVDLSWKENLVCD